MATETHKIDPKDYPFKQYIDEQKHLDADEKRHLIKPVVHIIGEHFKGREHEFCDKSQRDANGKFHKPKKVLEAEARGFSSVMEMYEADKKAEEDAKQKKIENLIQQTYDQNKTVEELRAVVEKQNKLLEYLMSKIK